MAEEFETVELEYSEDDIVYYLYDENDEEIGFVIEEDGQEIECYYEQDDETGSKSIDIEELDGEVVEMEIDEDAIDHYIFDEEGNEVGFVIVEDGVEIECYYQDDVDTGEDGNGEAFVKSDVAVGGGTAGDEDSDALNSHKAAENASPAEPETPEEPIEHGYLYKIAQIAGHGGNKARKKAGAQINKARDKAKPVVSQARTKAEAGIDKATEAVETGGQKLKEKKDEYDLGITREGVAEATADLNAIAKEGAETAKELKEAYDDIMDSFGFLMPKGIRRKLP